MESRPHRAQAAGSQLEENLGRCPHTSRMRLYWLTGLFLTQTCQDYEKESYMYAADVWFNIQELAFCSY